MQVRTPIGRVACFGPATAGALMALGVLGISLSAPIATATTAPALAVALWRSAFGALATAPVVAALARTELHGLDRSRLLACAWSGVLLAAHFGLWIPSLRMTTVTASTALVTTAPVWVVVIGRVRGERIRPRTLAGVGLAAAGVLAVTGIDAGRSSSAAVGDLLALVSGVAGAGYMLVGEHARRTTSTAVYTSLAYTSCAVTLLPVCLVAETPLAGWDTRTWVELAVLTLAAQLLGHTALNAALPVVGATTIALSTLLEVPGAALVAWAWLGQRPPATVIPAALLVLAGLWLVVRSRAHQAGTAHHTKLASLQE